MTLKLKVLKQEKKNGDAPISMLTLDHNNYSLPTGFSSAQTKR
jgi:hypothetical protein